MRVQRFSWNPSAGWIDPLPSAPETLAQLVLSFGPVDTPPAAWFDEVRALWPSAQHVYASGGGQITESALDDEVTVVSVLEFEHATVHTVSRSGVTMAGSAEMGEDIGRSLADIPDLRHVLIFAEGLTMNGDAFVNALTNALPASVSVSGGLASNGLALSRTVVGLDTMPEVGNVVAVALAGTSLSIGTGSVGGWDLFGPERVVTRSDTAVVYELDGENALEVYKRYLGNFASELPGVALLFPLEVRQVAGGPVAVRSILAVDEALGALRFAGDIPQGSRVRLMRASTDKLVDGASSAARLARGDEDSAAPSFTLCISCIGRRAVMRSRSEEELEEVVLASAGAQVVGFYSNGEIAPPSDGRTHSKAMLHNQTMTVTSIGER